MWRIGAFLVVVLSGAVAAVIGLGGSASAVPTLTSVSTSADYLTVTVVFSETVTGSGTDGAVEPVDVAVTGAGATLDSVTHAGDTLVFTFDGAIQPADTVLTFAGTNASSVTAGVPLAPADWTAIQAALRAIPMPVAEVPIAPFLDRVEGAERTLSELLPTSMPTSLDLPAPITVDRNGDGSFTASFDGTPTLATRQSPAVVVLDEVLDGVDPVPYGLELVSTDVIDIDISVAGTVDLGSAGAASAADLTVQIVAADSLELRGGVGVVEATVQSVLDLDVAVGFDLDDTTDDTAVVTVADADLGDVTIAGLGVGGADIDVTGAPLLAIAWPSLPTFDDDGVRTETGTVVDTGWTADGLQQLANVQLNDLLGAPGALATWIDSAQSLGDLATALPGIGTSLGDTLGIAESLATVHNQVAAAAEIASGGVLAVGPPPLLSASLCTELEPSAVRAAEVAQVIASFFSDPPAAPTPQEILDRLGDVTVDDAAVTAAFAAFCDTLFGSIELDLVDGVVETSVDIPPAVFDFLMGDVPSLDLSYGDGAGLEQLAIGLDGGTWNGTAAAELEFTLGVKLAADSALLTHPLKLDVDGDGDIDESDVTAAYRIYVPAGLPLATSSVDLTGTDIAGFAQLGFLDLQLAGEVALTPSVSLTTVDPAGGLPDGRTDLLELFAAASLDGTGDIGSVLDVGLAGDDVELHLDLSNSLLGTAASLDVVGDISALIDGTPLEIRATAIDSVDDVDAGVLAIGTTFGPTFDIAAMSPFDAVALVADLLDQVASSAAADAGDERIPVIDVSLDEVAGFTDALSGVADTIRDRAPTSVSDLVALVNDALADNGMGAATVGFTPAGPSGDPELTLTLDAGVAAAASYPVNFEVPDLGAGQLIDIAPADGGARLDAAVQIDFDPTLGVRFQDGIAFRDALFVRDLDVRFDFLLSGSAEGTISIGPLAASLAGDVSIGDDDLSTGGFTAALETPSGDTTLLLSDLVDGNVSLALGGGIDVDASVELSVPTPLGDLVGAIAVTGTVPGDIDVVLDVPDPSAFFDQLSGLFVGPPNLRALAEGAVATSRFIARSAPEIGELSGQLPVVGDDVAAQYDAISGLLSDIADELAALVDELDTGAEDVRATLETEINDLFADIGCPFDTCEVELRWTPDDPATTFSTATGIELLLNVAHEVDGSTSTNASFGLEPVIELELDVTGADAKIGFEASIGLGVNLEDGFYLFPGIEDGDPSDGVGTLFELYAALDLTGNVTVDLAGVEANAIDATVTVSGGLQVDPVAGGTAAGLKIAMPDRLPMSELVNRARPLSEIFQPSLDADIHANLPISFEIALGAEPLVLDLPMVFNWKFEDTLRPDLQGAEFDIKGAQFNIGGLASVVGDVLSDFDLEYNPLSPNPNAEMDLFQPALDTEVPLIGLSVRDAILATCEIVDNNACKAFTFLSGIDSLASDLDDFSEDIPLGSFRIFPTPTGGQSRYTPPTGASVLAAPPGGGGGAAAAAGGGLSDLQQTISDATRGYMTLPILDELPTVLQIVLGGELSDDVDIVRFEIPANAPLTVGYSIAVKQTLASIDSAFIEGSLKAELNGGLGLMFSGGFGYNTRAIGSGNFFDGLFLIDNESIEISLGAGISAAVDGRFAVSFGDIELGSVRFRGGGSFSATAGLDLFDESPVLVGRGGGDGRLFFDEIATIADAYEFPGFPDLSALCIFQLRTKGDWSIHFAGKAKVFGITVFDESFRDGGTLWDETISCNLRPRIARVEDRQLILHAGPNASDRFDGLGDIAEGFALTREGGNVRVAWTGPGTKPSLVFPLASFDTIIADMGAQADALTVADDIVKPVYGRGGPGTDSIDGGGGNDDLGGGPGVDTITGGPGNDRIRGGGAGDTLRGQAGNDDIDGQGDGDRVGFDDGDGNDVVADTGTTGVDTLDFGDVSTPLAGTSLFGEATVATTGLRVTHLSSEFERIEGGADDDDFTFKDQIPHGFHFDGEGGSDDVTFIAGRRSRTVDVHDTGTGPTDDDTVTVLGGAGRDVFLLRATPPDAGPPALDVGFVAKLSDETAAGYGLADRYDYDSTIERLVVDGGLGGDEFTTDDNATDTEIIGGPGVDIIQVGQIYGLADCDGNGTAEGACPDEPGTPPTPSTDRDSVRSTAVNVGIDDAFETTVITRGHLSNGATHPLDIDAGDGGDFITVFANKAAVTARGGPGNDEFVARAFIITGSLVLNGEGDIDHFDYVVNEKIEIDGGPGVDTFTAVGTEANDGFIIDVDEDGLPTVQICPIGADGRPVPDQVPVPADPAYVPQCAVKALVEAVEVFAVVGLEGDDVFWIRNSAAGSFVKMFGGDHSDTFLIGDGDLTGIQGPLSILGDATGNVPAIPDPVALPLEDITPAFEPAVTGGTDRGDELDIDATTDPNDLDGEITDVDVQGFGMADGPFPIGVGDGALLIDDVLTFDELEFITAGLGLGDDDVLVTSTHAGNVVCDAAGCPLDLLTGDGDDEVDIESISGQTVLDLGDGDDIARVGRPAGGNGTLDAIDAGLTVIGGPDDDVLDLDDTADGPTRLDVDPGLVTNAGLHPAGVAHTAVETVHARLGASSDVVNVRGTASDATRTEIHGNGGSERFYVSSTAYFDTGTSTDDLGGHVDDVLGDLFIHGDGGVLNQLYVSDRSTAAGDTAVTYDGAALTGLAPATINHDVTGAFGGGITVWASEHADVITVSGTDRSTVPAIRTLTSFNTGDGGDDVTVALASGADGPFVLNTEEGADVVRGGASSLDLLVFGGLGLDDVTTGSGDDIVFGDLGSAATVDGGTVTGGGGPGDATDGGTQPIDQITSDAGGGDDDTIRTGAGDDVAIGGVGTDDIGGGDDDDILIGGHLVAGGADAGDAIDGGSGRDLIAGDNATFVRTAGTVVLTLHDVETTAPAALAAGTGGSDHIDGGDHDDAIFGQQGDDDLSGEGGDDTIEGNAGDDTISGGADQDDLVGGGSALDGIIDDDRSWTVAGIGLADGNDTIDGDGGADVVLGDNGWIVRTATGDGSPMTLGDQFGSQNPEFDDVVVRDARVTDGLDPAGSFGADLLRGGDGPDELHGQLDTTRTTAGGSTIAGDEILGGSGADVLIGDLAVVVTVLEDGSRAADIAANGPFLSATIHEAGTLTREVTLFFQHDGDHVDVADGSDSSQFGAEGDDVLLGGDDDDVVHGGSGDDIANGGDGDDVVFGGDGDDAAWGGPGDDELFGGHDEDSLDVAPRDFTTTTKGRNRTTLGPDPAIWFEVAPTFDALAGLDLAYGGWNSDEMQADVHSNGPKPGDRLVDWNGAYNRYLSCRNGGGAGTFLRSGSPSVREFLADLAQGRGASDAATAGSSGSRELGLVEIADGRRNAGSVGGTDHITCP